MYTSAYNFLTRCVVRSCNMSAKNCVLGRITRQDGGAFSQADSHGVQCGTGGLRPDLMELESIQQRDGERAAHDDDGFMLTSWFASWHAGARLPVPAEIFKV